MRASRLVAMTPGSSIGYHEPVMAGEVVRFLADAKSVLDGTLGGGGHAEQLLESGVETVTGIDRDPEAIAVVTRRLAPFIKAGRLSVVHGNYADVGVLPELADSGYDGILLDLGVSSHQLDSLDRGFTFRPGAMLDMRMSGADATAAQLLNTLDEGQLARVFRDYGDEPRGGRLAREIIRRRATEPFGTSDDLVRAIRGALGPRTGPSDFARLFQAVRIAVNDEAEGLRRALPALRERLTPGGTLVIITYHSGEDRQVKHAFRDWSADCICPPKQMRCTCRGSALGETLTRRAIVPTEQETGDNPRARSAKLRAWRSRSLPRATAD